MSFNPKDIDTTYPSKEQLEKEGWAIDDEGKNMLHPQYGEKAPWISERNKKLVGEKNYNWTGTGPAAIGSKEYHRRRYLANREEMLERSKKYQKENPEVARRANKKYYEKKVRNKNEFSKECNPRNGK
jgi:hypothetical protein